MFCNHCGADNVDTASSCFACQRPLVPPPQITGSARVLLANNTLIKGRYRIINCIGQGGFGSVYKAEDTQLHRNVAVKEIDLTRLTSQEIIEATDAFNREVAALSQLRHPNLPEMYDHFTDSNHWYLIINYIAGETLERYLEQAALSITNSGGIQIQDVLRIGIQLCTVLDYMHHHSPPIIFRDLKPANIILDPARRTHLIDFGIARHFKPGQARDTIAFGSPGYAAPEQYGKAQTTPRSDIYSLGAILHQMLTGKDPSESPFQFAPIRSYRPSLSIELETLLRRMVEMEPQKRPDDMAQVKKQLEHLLQHLGSHYAAGYQAAPALSQNNLVTPGTLGQSGYPPLAGISPAAGQQQVFYAPHSGNTQGQVYYTPSPQAAAKMGNPPKKGTTRRTVLITAGIMGTAWLFSSQIFQNHTDPLPKAAPGPVTAIGSTLDLEYASEFTVNASAINALAWPTGNNIFAASASDDKTVQIWTPGSNGANSSLVAVCHGHTQSVTTVAYSGDNLTLASGSLDKTVRLWNNKGKQKAIATFPGPIYSTSWNPDSSALAVACGDGKVYICNGTTLQTHSVYKGHTKSVRAVAWSPTGSYIASGGEDYTVQIWATTPNASAITTYRGHSNTINVLAWSPLDGSQIASGSSDRTVQIWNPLTGATNILYLGHMTNGTPTTEVDLSMSTPGEVYTIAWQPPLSGSSNSKLIASAGSSGILHIWNPYSGRVSLIKPDPNNSSIRATAWSSDGASIATAGNSGSVLIETLSS